MFAQISAEGWVLIIGSIFGGVALVLGNILTFLNGRAARIEAREARIAATSASVKVAEVAVDLKNSGKDARGKLDDIVAGNQEIHRIVNSNNEKLERRIQGLTEQLQTVGVVPRKTNGQ
jgi:hypothetical protein